MKHTEIGLAGTSCILHQKNEANEKNNRCQRAINLMKTTRRLIPRPAALSAGPDEVARHLSHLPGLVFFDTAGNLPSKHAPPLSIVGARPVDIIRGHISNPGHLEATLAQWASATSPDYGFPVGAACGWVDYDGQFTFGIYPELLVYHHQSGQWWETGNLSDSLSETPTSPPFSLGEWHDSLGRSAFIDALKTIKDYITAGDIYQVNLSRRLRAKCHAPDGLLSLYDSLRTS